MSDKPTKLPTNETDESSDNLVTWIGLHGTCVSRGEIILKQQAFRKPQSPGMAGTGIYFWMGEYSQQLASEWHAKRQGDFKYELKPECCILTCKITCNVNNTFHLADPLFISTIEKLVAHAKSGGRKFLSEEIMAKMHDTVIEELERDYGLVAHVIFKQVPPPDAKNTAYPQELKWPLCMMVRHATCIKTIDLLGA